MKLTILDYTHGKLHIYNVDSQEDVMQHVDAHNTMSMEADGWMLSQDNEFEIIRQQADYLVGPQQLYLLIQIHNFCNIPPAGVPLDSS